MLDDLVSAAVWVAAAVIVFGLWLLLAGAAVVSVLERLRGRP